MSTSQAITGWVCKECDHIQEQEPTKNLRECDICGDTWVSENAHKFCPNCGSPETTLRAGWACLECEEGDMEPVKLWMCTSCSKLHWSANEAEACCPDEED